VITNSPVVGTEIVSVATNGSQGNDISGDYSPRALDISADGRYVVFRSEAVNFDPATLLRGPNMFLRDRH